MKEVTPEAPRVCGEVKLLNVFKVFCNILGNLKLNTNQVFLEDY